MTRYVRPGLLVVIASLTLVFMAVIVFVGATSPLDALSSPFRFLISSRVVPERLRLEGGAQSVDPNKLSEALRQLVSSQQLRANSGVSDPASTAFYQTSFSDGKGSDLLLMKSGGEYVVQVFQHGAVVDSDKTLIDAVRETFIKLGFRDAVKAAS